MHGIHARLDTSLGLDRRTQGCADSNAGMPSAARRIHASPNCEASFVSAIQAWPGPSGLPPITAAPQRLASARTLMPHGSAGGGAGGGAPHDKLICMRALVPRALIHQSAIRARVLRRVQLDAHAPHVRREGLRRVAPPLLRRRLDRSTAGSHTAHGA